MNEKLGVTLIGIPLLMLLAAVLAFPLLAEEDGWTKYERLERGMTMPQVEAVLGGPRTSKVGSGSAWAVKGGTVVVRFDEQGHALEWSLHHSDRPDTP